MLVEKNASLQPYNTFGIAATAKILVRVRCVGDLYALHNDPILGVQPWRVLGGGSNIVLTHDVQPAVLKIEILGRRLVQETDKAWIVEAGAGELWHDTVAWTLAQGWPGLENLALIPGTVGAAPVQNIGAYGVELKDRFDSLDAVDLTTGQSFTLDAAQCAFGYRDSIFKNSNGFAGQAVITQVRFRLPKPWQPALGYADLARHCTSLSTPQQIFDWVCKIRRAKLPDPKIRGNAGSFFKNPTITPQQCINLLFLHPKIVHYSMPDGNIKLAAAWLIDACDWKGKTMGHAGVYEKQALILVNNLKNNNYNNNINIKGDEIIMLALAIQNSVYQNFGIFLEIEPVVW